MGCGMESGSNDYIGNNNSYQCETSIRQWETNNLGAFHKNLYDIVSKVNSKFLGNPDNIEQEISLLFNREMGEKIFDEIFKNEIFRANRDKTQSFNPTTFRILIFLLSKSNVKRGDRNNNQDKVEFLWNLVSDDSEILDGQLDFDKPNVIDSFKIAIELATVVLVDAYIADNKTINPPAELMNLRNYQTEILEGLKADIQKSVGLDKKNSYSFPDFNNCFKNNNFFLSSGHFRKVGLDVVNNLQKGQQNDKKDGEPQTKNE